MSPIDLVLGKLSDYGLKSSGRGRWVARCPAHQDRSPSLSVSEGDDGRVLMHCFAGCEIEQVCANLMLDLGDLFPPKPEGYGSGAPAARRARITYLQALQIVKAEVLLVHTAACNLAAGHALTPEDLARLTESTRRIESAMKEANV